MEQELRKLYLDMVRKTVLGFTFKDPSFNQDNGEMRPFDDHLRKIGGDWPVLAHTLVGMGSLQNIQTLLEDIIKNKIPGDYVETGVWRGGSCIFANAVLKAWGENRSIYACDSFEGWPKPKEDEYPVDNDVKSDIWMNEFLSVPLEIVKENFRNYDLLTDNVKFVKGFFTDTLPNLDVEKIALLRLDGDMYVSTIVALENLYPKLSVGGYVIIDDYGVDNLENAYRACEDYREFHDIDDEIFIIDPSAIGHESSYFQKTKEVDPEKAKHRFRNPQVIEQPTVPLHVADTSDESYHDSTKRVFSSLPSTYQNSVSDS